MNRSLELRVGAVAYLNARPLVEGFQSGPAFQLRFDPPSRCAELLHAGEIDVGMIPSIEYCRGPEYRIVPGAGITSHGEVASVALFTRKALAEVKTIAADTSSRTSNGLLRILCAERFGIQPEFRPMAPDPARMLADCDAALIIGDPALHLDPRRFGVEKIDLGTEWTTMTGLPFVWAFWAARPSALQHEDVLSFLRARDRGLHVLDRIADDYCGPERAARCRAYLRENIQYVLGTPEREGLMRYYALAEKHGLIAAAREPLFFE